MSINPEQIQNAIKLAQELNGKLDQLLKTNSELLGSLPPSEQKKVSFVVKDINEVRKAFKSGDIEALTRLTEKYADINSK